MKIFRRPPRQPGEVASLCVYLLSSSRVYHRADFPIDGGLTAR